MTDTPDLAEPLRELLCSMGGKPLGEQYRVICINSPGRPTHRTLICTGSEHRGQVEIICACNCHGLADWSQPMTDTPGTEDKHPISKDQPSRETTCWREHIPGYVCMLDEGHTRINRGLIIDTPGTDADEKRIRVALISDLIERVEEAEGTEMRLDVQPRVWVHTTKQVQTWLRAMAVQIINGEFDLTNRRNR